MQRARGPSLSARLRSPPRARPSLLLLLIIATIIAIAIINNNYYYSYCYYQ